ncbi:MAG: hypothetical protein ABIF19_18080 [Planctomycetota bacterium]
MNRDAVLEVSVVLLCVFAIAAMAWTFLVNRPERFKSEEACKIICAERGKDLSEVRSGEDGYTCWCTDAWVPAVGKEESDAE